MAGSGEPVLFIPGHVAVTLRPLMVEPSMADRHQLLRYHRRGMAGTTRAETPVAIADQARDAGALLAHLGIERAHVVGHSYGGLMALQLALDAPAVIGSLALLEPNLLAVPSGAAFNQEVRPAFAAYRAGDAEAAVAHFFSVVSGLPWAECQELIEQQFPGGVAQAIADSDSFFDVDIPALRHWAFEAEDTAGITCPVLSVLGSASHALFRDGRELLRSWFPQLEELDIPAAGHFLQLQNPAALARGLASFFSRHPL